MRVEGQRRGCRDDQIVGRGEDGVRPSTRPKTKHPQLLSFAPPSGTCLSQGHYWNTIIPLENNALAINLIQTQIQVLDYVDMIKSV